MVCTSPCAAKNGVTSGCRATVRPNRSLTNAQSAQEASGVWESWHSKEDLGVILGQSPQLRLKELCSLGKE